MKIPYTCLLISLLSCALLSCQPSRIDPGPAIPTSGIRTNFDAGTALSAEDLQDVLQLARSCGVSKIGEVSSVAMHPSGSHRYEVKSVEEVVGRKISFVTVGVHDRTSRSRSGQQGKVVKSLGRFVVLEHDIRTSTLTTFPTNRGSFLVRLEGIPLATADKIVRAFGEGDIRCQNRKDKETIAGLDLRRLLHLYSVIEGQYTLVFSTEDQGQILVYFALDSGTIVVTEIMNVMA